MKKFTSICFGLFMLVSLSLTAQDETLFSRGSSVGGFFSLLTEVGTINKDTRTSIGGGAGVVIDNMFVGAYGLGSANYEDWIQGDDAFVDIAHGGFWIGYNYKTYKLLHLYSSAKIGWGAIGINPDIDFNRRGNIDGVFVVTPEVGVELNVARWFRIAGTVSYRVVNGVDSPEYSNNDFSGLNAGFTMRFGWFGRKKDSF